MLMTPNNNTLRRLVTFLAVAASVTLLAVTGQRLTAGGQAQDTGRRLRNPTPQQESDCLAGGEARRVRSARTGALRVVGTEPGLRIFQPRQLSGSASPEAAARSYLSVCGTLFGLSEQSTQLALDGNKTEATGRGP